ncbi:MAG: endolytic transglycosylase MltG [Candidatus Dojkabacteria bacterium]|nr:endolytic transglycosylase MltG [Candidatus Dojkabacteria bacterium]
MNIVHFDQFDKYIKKNKAKNQLLIKLIVLLLIFIFIVGSVFFVFQSTMGEINKFGSLTSINQESKKIIIPSGTSFDGVHEILISEGIIPDEKIFGFSKYKLYYFFNPDEIFVVQAGEYIVNPNTKVKDIFSVIGCKEVTVTIKEGLRIEEIAEVLEKNLPNFDKNEFINLAKNFSPNNELKLEYKEIFPKFLEGYLFPDTYRFCDDTEEIKVIEKMLITFEQKVYLKIKNDLEKNNKDLNEIINIASMIEKESLHKDDESYMISGIIYNRLQANMPLGIDATSQYGGGYNEKQKTWWPTGSELDRLVTEKDPYNTRLNLGLPPTPISNPGLESIDAAVNPKKSDYYYYLHDSQGNIYYAKNLNEHNRNVCRYLGRCN